MSCNYLIKNALVVNEGEICQKDIFVIDGLIEEIAGRIDVSDDFRQYYGIEILDMSGKYVMPGIIDDQVHFREPGLEYKGDIASESAAAVAGGVTSFMDMPNVKPPTTTLDLLEQKYAAAAERSSANFSFYLGATNDNIGELKNFNPENNCGIKVFLGASTGNMLVDDTQALQQIFGLPHLIAIHSEDENIIRANAEIYRQKYGEEVPVACHPLIRSAEACFVSTKRAVEMAEKNGTRLHILHLSTAAELDLLNNKLPLA
ncbi:MAG TPA: amidohydrolase family protein, partial [Bacteroidales bacterium]|nr:amidohydrolase family protein [Bacteroidales bacterium]